MSDETTEPVVDLVDNRAAVIREITVAIEQLREISAQFHHNEGWERLQMHQEIVRQICELAKLVQSAANPNSVIARVSK